MSAPAVNLEPGLPDPLTVYYGSDFERDYTLAVDITGAEIVCAVVDLSGAVLCVFDITVTTPTNPCTFTKTLSRATMLDQPLFYPGGVYKHDMRIVFADGKVKNITPVSPLIVQPTATPVT